MATNSQEECGVWLGGVGGGDLGPGVDGPPQDWTGGRVQRAGGSTSMRDDSTIFFFAWSLLTNNSTNNFFPRTPLFKAKYNTSKNLRKSNDVLQV